MIKKAPLITVFKTIVGNYTFRVYDHVPNDKKSRFIIDDDLKYRTDFVSKTIWKKKLFVAFEKEVLKFGVLNNKIDEAINLFFKNSKD